MRGRFWAAGSGGIMVSEKCTTERLFERYHTYSRRPAVGTGRAGELIFKSFRRTLGPWLPEDRSAKILDIACGEGALLAFLKEQGYTNLHGFDISPENVALCHRLGLTFVQQFDALRLNELPEGEFDVIFALDLLEHLPKERAAGFLEEVRNKLKPGGYVVLQTPNMGCVFGLYHRYFDLSHQFCLTEKTAVALLMIAGFAEGEIEVRPAWNAATALGRLREIYLRCLHRVIYLAEDASRPRIPTKNLLIRGIKA